MIFILLCIAGIAVRIYKKKSAYKKKEVKGSENEDSAETALKSDLSVQNTVTENQKEYFFWFTFSLIIMWQSDFLAKPGAFNGQKKKKKKLLHSKNMQMDFKPIKLHTFSLVDRYRRPL